jgi:hypothetical protein
VVAREEAVLLSSGGARLLRLGRGSIGEAHLWVQPQKVRLSEITELDEAFCLEGSDEVPTYRQIAEDVRLIEEADLRFPIIMSSDRRVMDGMHRVLKALNAGMETIDAVIFEQDPEPDYVDVYPSQLPY